ncbi:uncharacterized protein LOC132048818 [Lycium ferocissimum]|uniref:uncharacterized protein LOC132048818 n=1 Tax=Lycium ferocissimum TaxID=112874 RepID=UPI002815E634|nr:uncharacterized protein LOC132048818 [Lycium ferocissimum]
MAAQSRQKLYADRKIRNLDFIEVEQVFLKIYEVWKRGNLSSRYIDPFEILRRVGNVTYELALPPVFIRFSMFLSLKRYHSDGSYIVRWDSVLLDKNLSYEEELIAILDRQVRKLRSKKISSVKVQW